MSRRSIPLLVCGILALLALGSSGCKRQTRVIANRLGPVATQAARINLPPTPHPSLDLHAQSALQNEKTAYVTSARTQLDQLDQQIAPLRGTTARTMGPSRLAYDKLLRDYAAKRAAFQVDVASIPSASQDGWPVLKAKSDRDLVAMRGAAVAASSRIPTPPRGPTAAAPAKPTR